jgi:hypothetical protein
MAQVQLFEPNHEGLYWWMKYLRSDAYRFFLKMLEDLHPNFSGRENINIVQDGKLF